MSVGGEANASAQTSDGGADPWRGMYTNPWAVKRIQLAVELARPWLADQHARVAEFGCYRQELKKWLPHIQLYHGYDQQQYVPEGYVYDGETEWMPSDLMEKYDVVFCLETLEHLKHPDRLLSFMKWLLPTYPYPMGRLILSLPNEATLFHRLRALTGVLDPMAFQPGKHLHLPNVSQTIRWLESQGLVIEAMRPYIDLSAAKSTHPWVGRVMQMIPEGVWMQLAHWSPNLFARGMVYRCTVRPTA